MKARRFDILKRKDEVIKWIEESQPKSFISKNLDCKPETLDGYLKHWGIEYRGVIGRMGFQIIPVEIYLNNEKPIKSNELKLKLYESKLKEKQCEECNIIKWNDKEVIFELHHIDGDNHNNNLSNLKVLCPNCHSQTEHFRKKKYDQKNHGV
jgi:5-methylcytosine-specific restriction endonuclease McrA